MGSLLRRSRGALVLMILGAAIALVTLYVRTLLPERHPLPQRRPLPDRSAAARARHQPPGLVLIDVDGLTSEVLQDEGVQRDAAPNLTLLARSGVLASAAQDDLRTQHDDIASLIGGLTWPRVGMSFLHRGPALWPAQQYDELVDGAGGEADEPLSLTDRTDTAVATLAEHAGRPFFLQIRYSYPALERAAPLAFQHQIGFETADLRSQKHYAWTQYLARLAWLDAEIGRMVEALERLERRGTTLLVVRSLRSGDAPPPPGRGDGEEQPNRSVVVLSRPGTLRAGLVLSEPLQPGDLPRTALSVQGLAGDHFRGGRDLSAQVTLAPTDAPTTNDAVVADPLSDAGEPPSAPTPP